ncbi:uncharacterized protein LOC114931870 [Nylanderia fulva]|uniref:uncharacterized protein LOC114931870 n=1 Tax=Nylanderia fulva TaxID=613905 RepID=UPI0010FAEF8D|nr:uncharacterized protein LOC114931870 [Nylanderia fulva]
MHLHSQLRRIALDINGLFEIQMTLQTMTYFVSLTTMLYSQYHLMLCLMYNGGAIQWKCLLPSNMWCAINLTRLVTLNYICESVSAKARKTEGIIHKLSNICFAKAREEICQFVLQISLQPLKFSGMGLFYFGHKFLFKCFVGILSIIVIIIQMDTPVHRKASKRDNIICHQFSE